MISINLSSYDHSYDSVQLFGEHKDTDKATAALEKWLESGIKKSQLLIDNYTKPHTLAVNDSIIEGYSKYVLHLMENKKSADALIERAIKAIKNGDYYIGRYN